MAALDHPTGDAPGTLEALRTDLNHIKYPHGLNSVRALAGDAAELLPVLSFALLRFSRHVALLCQDYQLHGKTDQRFVDAAWKFLRDGLGLPKLALTPTQFLSEGFAERKLLLLRQIIRACKDHHNAAARKDRLAALKGNTHSEQRLYLSPQQRQQQPATSKQPVPRPAPAKVIGPLTMATRAAEFTEALDCSVESDRGCSDLQQPGQGTSCSASKSTTTLEADLATAIAPVASSPALEEVVPAAPPITAACHAQVEAEQPRPLPAFMQQQGQQLQPSMQIPQPLVPCDTGQPAATLLAGKPGLSWQSTPAAQQAQQPVLPMPVGHMQASGGVPSFQLGSGAQLPTSGVALAQPWNASAPQLAVKGASGADPPVSASLGQGLQATIPSHLGLAGNRPFWSFHPTWQQPQAQQLQHFISVAPQPVPFPLEQQGGLHAQQHGAASSLAAAYQTVPVDQPAMALALLGQQYSTPDVATLRLIEDLHLRLKLAEEAALEARHSSEAMQEGLQARLAVLEGRVKFLEGGFGLQPLQLPWVSPSKPSEVPRLAYHTHAATLSAPTEAIQAHWATNTMPEQEPPPPPPKQQQHSHSPSAYAASQGASAIWSSGQTQEPSSRGQQRSSCQPGLLPQPGSAVASVPPGSAGRPHPQCSPALDVVSQAPAASAALRVARTSSTAELISSMHSRVSEADEFLRSLRRH